MSLPGPAAFARRCLASLVRRPADALAPYLHESYSERPTLSEEWLTITAGAGSSVVVAATTALALALSAAYALLYVGLRVLRRGVSRVGAGARSRLGR
ncbi:hypothetical protein [Halarchaeum nitratireducens]|uniref:Uncharacterized protein n=1 Tax=Halarchaeum nitratireducens TaxID=489913 RepID=A0A830GD39_9EURY|nr:MULTISPECIES: hypothetical protein [Halarchaeum]MBP2251725.1 hypothetical protein [Halarchaeum solikamskense]GGN22715.1 hypothetical protein GCM10009021_25360 [Halarchaeum nitratireducens]